ncbi:hypothetical protein D6C91_06313 [Aureobasidium pullulans]|uniref:Uncharacterized protein n=1 Tax=Aureobasidium pullulans TaxID=5580 RepID=A0A4S9SZ93_AURPU|nr:hypothetical protein D6C91_06313 [Aureobasidium pullulans]
MEPHLGAITENIAFLAFLKHRGRSKTNPIPLCPCNSSKDIFSLSFKHEVIIGKAFALILVNTNDKSKVGAVCIEERVDQSGITVRSATNTGSQEKRESAFTRIAKLLEHLSASRRDEKQQNELLFEIICVCQNKILGRLRSRHAPQTKKNKRPLLRKLWHVMEILKKYDHRSRHYDNLEIKANTVIDLLKALERHERAWALGHEGSKCIQEMFRGVQALLPQILESRKRLSTMEAESLEPVEHLHLENLIERLEKLDQYRHAAMNLISLRRRYRILRNIKFEGVTMSNCPNEGKSMDLCLTNRGLFTQFYARQEVDHGRPSSFPCTPETYQKIRTAARQKSKVHAEIQLLYFYESMGSDLGVTRPRVICSEKHACFLCDTFIRAHAQFYTASTHGTFYSQWRLPRPGEFKVSSTSIMAALNRFNISLEGEIMARLLHGPQLNLSVPESVLVEAETFTPSLQSSVYTNDRAQTFDDLPDRGKLSYASTVNRDEIFATAKLFRNGRSKSATVLNTVSATHLDETLPLKSMQGTVISVPDSSLCAIKELYKEDENATFVSSRRSITDFGRPTFGTSRILAFDNASKDCLIMQYAESDHAIATIVPGQNLTTYLSPGCTVQVHTPYIHLHLEYASIAPRAELRSDLILNLTCAVGTIDGSEDERPPSTWIDLGARGDKLPKTLPENALLQEGGIKLCKHDQFVTLRALVNES